jgi:D-Tyr-tRNAtyr deacylase
MSSGSVYIVVQRFRECKLLINELEYANVGSSSDSCGLLAYVSFASSTTPVQVEQAAGTLLNLPVLTTGLWGDGESSTLSVLALSVDPTLSCSLVIVPQANLISKVKQQGKSIQYHGQINKDRGEELYQYFCECIKGKLLEAQCSSRSQDLPEWYKDRKRLMEIQANNSQPSCVSKPPEQLFRVDSKYSEWNEKGLPIKDADGNELSKSQLKKLTKIYESHCKRHAKWTENGGSTASNTYEMDSMLPGTQWGDSLDPSFCHFVAGSFGKRQGIELKSDMGPFVVSIHPSLLFYVYTSTFILF